MSKTLTLEQQAAKSSFHISSNVKRWRTKTTKSRTVDPLNYGRTKHQVESDPKDNSQEEHGVDRAVSSAARTELRMWREERDSHGELYAVSTRTRARCVLTSTEQSFSESVMEKWVPISEEAISIMMDAITHSSSIVGRKMESDAASRQIAADAIRVREELTKAIAPKEGQQIPFSTMMSSCIIGLESDLSSLVSENNSMEDMILDQQRLRDLQEKTQLLTRITSSRMADTSRKEMLVDLKNKSSKEWTLETPGEFCNHIANIISQESNSSDLNLRLH